MPRGKRKPSYRRKAYCMDCGMVTYWKAYKHQAGFRYDSCIQCHNRFLRKYRYYMNPGLRPYCGIEHEFIERILNGELTELPYPFICWRYDRFRQRQKLIKELEDDCVE